MNIKKYPMKDRVCLVTGATSGVGRAIAAGLSGLQAQVVLLVRNAQRGLTVQNQISQKTGNERIEVMEADLSVQADIRDFASRFIQRYPRLNVLSLNHGVLLPERQLSKDGIEMTWAVNYLSYFMLANLLSGALKAGAPSRIASVVGTPSMLRWIRIHFENLQSETRYNGFTATGRSVLARLIFTTELADRFSSANVSAHVFHPGLVRSDFGRNLPPFLRFMHALAIPFMRSSCPTGVRVCSDPDLQHPSGRYFVGRRTVRFKHPQLNRTVQAHLWKVSHEMTGAG